MISLSKIMINSIEDKIEKEKNLGVFMTENKIYIKKINHFNFFFKNNL
jgi:hypothetical protein